MQAIQYHYDVSNEFYQLWLDEKMIYSCAYFKDPDESIDAAQARKLDYICRKLRLEPGDRLLDIGCGWGALIMHAAEHYGVEALGITLSEKQLALANERIEAAGLADRCRAEMLDYRNVDENMPFDKIVSVGMVEHVGRENLAIYFEKSLSAIAAWRRLSKPRHYALPSAADSAVSSQRLVRAAVYLPGRGQPAYRLRS